MIGPRRDPTARRAIANILREEARAKRMNLRAYLRHLESDPEQWQQAATRLHAMIAQL